MGRYDYLYVRPFTRATARWANSIVDALNELYDIDVSIIKGDFVNGVLSNLDTDIIPAKPVDLGTSDHPFDQVVALNGYFYYDLYVQGKKVLKDDDPIHIADLYPEAIYDFCEGVECGIKKAINIDQYGNAGVIIHGPLDQYGHILCSTDRYFRPVYNKTTVSASENTNGVELELDTGGRPTVTVAYSLSQTAQVIIEGSNDGVFWYQIMTLNTSGTNAVTFTTAFRLIRVRETTPGVDVTIEISATR